MNNQNTIQVIKVQETKKAIIQNRKRPLKRSIRPKRPKTQKLKHKKVLQNNENLA